jgi:hypothetical protein
MVAMMLDALAPPQRTHAHLPTGPAGRPRYVQLYLPRSYDGSRKFPL